MTFEELRKAAHSGDVEAMEYLGGLYVGRADELFANGEPNKGVELYEAAAQMFESLAERGYVISGYYNWVYVQDVLSRIALVIGCFSSTEWLPKFNQAIKYCNLALEREQELDNRKQSIITLRNNMLIKSAVAFESMPNPATDYASDYADYDSSIRCLREAVCFGCEGAKVMLGLSYFNRYTNAEESEYSDIERAFEELKNVDILSEEVSKSFDVPIVRERTQAQALLRLAKMYQVGIKHQKDTKRAFDLLQSILSHTWYEDIGGVLEASKEELKHYKKDFWGRLVYVD